MKLREIGQHHKLLFTTLVVITIIFVTRGGYSLWIANKIMLVWIEQLPKGLTTDEIVIPDTIQIRNYMPSSAALVFGRVAFKQKNYQEALSYFEQADDLVGNNPIILAEKAIALSYTVQFMDVISLYKSKGDLLLWNREVQDAILLAYLHKLDMEQITTADILPELQELDPEELYTKSLILKEQTGASSLLEMPVEVQRQLTRFAMEAIAPSDKRLLNYTIRILPELVDSGLWDDERLANVLQFWLWQYPDSPALDEVLKTLAVNYPKKIDWLSLRNELDLRRSGQVENVIHQLTVTSVNDTPNMIFNGGFDVLNYEDISGWHVADYNTGRGKGEPNAAFFMDIDEVISVSSPYSLRIEGIWDDGATGFFGALALRSRAEGIYFLSLLPQQAYQISGYYRTRGESERVSVYIGSPTAGLLDVTLPATAGEWRMFSHSACHGSEQTESMQMLLRLHTSGAVWFDDLMLQLVPLVDPDKRCLP